MLFILNIIKNNHAQGENTKMKVFSPFCLQLFISSSNARKASHAILSEHLY